MYKNTTEIPEYVAIAYRGRRDIAYPQLREQLDMLWHDVNAGLFGEGAKQSQWFLAIQAVKNTHPKPE